MQQGMLFHALSAPGTGVDMQHIRIDVAERIDLDRLRHAWSVIVDRHDILRARFVVDGPGAPTQVFEPDVDVPVIGISLSQRPATEHEAEIELFCRSDRLAGFDLGVAPALRVAVFDRGETATIIWTFHHILLDGRSFPIVLRDLFAIYDGEALPSPEPRPYREYLEWFGDQDHSSSDAYWSSTLAPVESPTPLPFSSGELPVVASALDALEIRLGGEQLADLQARAVMLGARVSTLIETAWAVLLAHLTGQETVAYGVTRACRHGLDSMVDMVGVFINTVPVVAVFAADMSVDTAVADRRSSSLAVRAHEHTPLSVIHRSARIPATEPLFRTLLVFENYELDEALKTAGTAWSSRDVVYRGQTNMPLTLMAYEGSQLRLRFEFDATVIPQEAVEGIAERLTVLLGNFAHCDPADPVLAVEYLRDAERTALLDDWNPAYGDRQFAPVCERIRAAGSRTPNSPAIVAGDQTLTYDELDGSVERLAKRLSVAGVGRGSTVGVCVPRSSEVVVALLAVMRTGATFVPLDPIFPRDRLAHMVTDSGMRVAVTTSASAELLPGVEEILLLDDESATARFDEPCPAVADDVVYTIYTSGSTGVPKGVDVLHDGLSNFIDSMAATPGLSDVDRLLAVTTVSFDIANLEMFLPLAVGAVLILADDDQTHDGTALTHLIESSSPTVMQATPATWQMVIESGWTGTPGLTVLCGGEALPRRLADQLLDRCDRLWNMYGPTETTIWSSVSEVMADGAPISIGRPIAATSMYVLDPRRQPVAIGAVGELWIGGRGVAAGYRGRDDLTTERFVPNPFRAGDRMYRTGDQARVESDGTIICLGRIDNQVKIRGFRIELDEIEAVLSRHAGVADAVVVARTSPAGVAQLVGYVVASGVTPPSVAELRKACATKLPDYMVPATFMFLDTLPLTDNNKVARDRLPDPGSDRPDLGHVFVAPSGPTEMAVAEAFSAVLMVDGIGADDSFFDLGGDSLLVVRLLNDLRTRLGTAPAVHDVFGLRTVRGIASALAEPAGAAAAESRAGVDDRVARRNQALAQRRAAARRPTERRRTRRL